MSIENAASPLDVSEEIIGVFSIVVVLNRRSYGMPINWLTLPMIWLGEIC